MLDTPPYLAAASLSALAHVRHGFFGRRGGVSEGLYESLNCGPGSQDAPEAVAANRALVTRCLGADRLITAHQVHSAKAARVESLPAEARPEVDGLVTTSAGVALGALAADCAPILFADSEARVIGAAHAGWRGALDGVCEATLDAMEAAGGARARIHAVVGPCIAQPAYEVGPEFVDRFVAANPGSARYFAGGAGDRAHFDLKAYVADRLRSAGVGSVESLADCTCTDEIGYFSNRRRTLRGESDYGRNIAVIMLVPIPQIGATGSNGERAR